jgi:hypothetical protein
MNEEFNIPHDFSSYERVRAIKEGMACFLGSEVKDIKIVGISLILFDSQSGVMMEHKEKVAWFDELEYEDD